MRSSGRNSVNSVSHIGSGSSIQSMALPTSVAMIRIGGFMSLSRFEGPWRSRSSLLPRYGDVGGRPGWRFLRVVLASRREPNSAPRSQHEIDTRASRTRCSGRRVPQASTSKPRSAPASPLPLVELVRGEIDAFLAERYHKWDHAPWVLLVEEAGGRFTDRTGGRATDQGGGLYSNALLHSQLLAALHYPTRP